MPKVQFPLSQTVATPGTLPALEQLGSFPSKLLHRHAHGDWGDLSPEDKEANEQALAQGLRILSAYHISSRKFWVITEANRSVTTVLLPEEY